MESVKYLRSKEGLFEVNRTLGQDYLKTLKSQIGVNIGYDLHIAQKGLLFFSLRAEFFSGKDKIASYDVMCAYAATREVVDISDGELISSTWFNNCTEEVVGYFRGSFSVLSKNTPADGINLFNISIEELKSHVKITKVKEQAYA